MKLYRFSTKSSLFIFFNRLKYSSVKTYIIIYLNQVGIDVVTHNKILNKILFTWKNLGQTTIKILCFPGQLVRVEAFSHKQFLNSCSTISEPFCSLAFTVHNLIVPLTDTPTITSSCLLPSVFMHNAFIHWCCSRDTNV